MQTISHSVSSAPASPCHLIPLTRQCDGLRPPSALSIVDHREIGVERARGCWSELHGNGAASPRRKRASASIALYKARCICPRHTDAGQR